MKSYTVISKTYILMKKVRYIQRKFNDQRWSLKPENLYQRRKHDS